MSEDGESCAPSGCPRGGWINDADEVMVVFLDIGYFREQWVEDLVVSIKVVVSWLRLMSDE